MTTTNLIKLLQSVEYGASGRSREISIYKQNEDGTLERLLKESDELFIFSTGDGCCGAELALKVKDTTMEFKIWDSIK